MLTSLGKAVGADGVAPARSRGGLIAGMASIMVMAWVCAAGAQDVRDVPFRLDPLRTPEPNRDTVALWRFEDGDAVDTTAFRNHGRIRGRVTAVADGRFGRGMALGGADAGLELSGIRGWSLDTGRPLSIDFWFYPEAYPERNAALLAMAGSGDRPVVEVAWLPDGRLRLNGSGVAAADSAPLPLDQWVHVAIQGITLYQANYVYVDQAGIELLTNGFSAARAFAATPNYTFPPSGTRPIISIGNNLDFSAGVNGRIDEFRLSATANGFYRLYRQAFVTAEPAADEWPDTFFQAPDRRVFRASFDDADAPSRVIPPSEPKRIRTAPEILPLPESGGAPVATPKSDTLADLLGGDLLAEMEADAAAEAGEGDAVPVRSVPGVRGQALAVAGGVARIDLPAGLNLREGSLTFWLQPGDWDNLSRPPGRNDTFTYRHARPHIVTLWGRPRDGEGRPERLVTLSISRLQGGNPVAPAIEQYFGRPRIPIVPHRWVHVLLAWGPGLPHYQPHVEIDGRMLPYDERTRSARLAERDIWERYEPAYLTLGNGLETFYDEINLFAYPFALGGPERANVRARYSGAAMTPLGNALAAFQYRMAVGELLVTLTPLHRHRDAVAAAALTFTGPDGAVTGRIDAFTNGLGRLSLPVGLLPEGDHPIRGRLLDADGADVAAFESVFTRKPIPWYDNRIGYRDTPPPPFSAVRRDGDTVHAVGRAYQVADDGNFSQITVLDEPILAAPIHFAITANDASIPLRGVGPATFGATQPNKTGWRAQARAAGITIVSDVHFEYDGMARYTLDIQPVDGPVTVERLALQIPLKQQYGWLIHALPVDGNFRHYHFYGTGTLRDRQGTVWDSKTFSASRATRKMTAGNFVPSVWLGGAVRGLYWFADNDAGWVPSEEQPAITVNWENEIITLSLNFISEPFTLDAPRRIEYALMGMPPKPLPEKHRAWNRSDYRNYPGLAGRLTSCEAFAPWELPVKSGAMDYWPIGNDWEYAEMAARRQRVSTHNKYPPGVAFMLYHDKRFVPLGPDTEYFAWEWQRQGQGAWSQTKIDCLIWYMDQWFGRDIMDGIYIDDVFPIADHNWETGSAYRLPDGRVQPGSANFAYRDYLKRLYNVLVAHGKPPIITLHSTHTFPPFISFATLSFDGEDGSGFKSDGSATFIDATWRLDRLMTLDIAERTGMVSTYMLKSDYYLQDRFSRTHHAHMIHRVLRSKLAMDLLFDWNHPPSRWAAAYMRPGVEVLPFWRNDDQIRIEVASHDTVAKVADAPPAEPDPLHAQAIWSRACYGAMLKTDPLRATIYRRDDDRALIVVVNLLKQPLTAAVTLDLERLGIPPERRAAIALADIDDGGAEMEGVDLLRMEMPDGAAINGLAVLTDAAPDQALEALLTEVQVDLTQDPDEWKETLILDNGQFELSLPAHDFRAIEMRW